MFEIEEVPQIEVPVQRFVFKAGQLFRYKGDLRSHIIVGVATAPGMDFVQYRSYHGGYLLTIDAKELAMAIAKEDASIAPHFFRRQDGTLMSAFNSSAIEVTGAVNVG